MSHKMIFYCISRLVLLLAFGLILGKVVMSQSDTEYTWEPKISVSKEISSIWEAQSFIKVRQNVDFTDENLIAIEKAEAGAGITRAFFNDTKAGLAYVFIGEEMGRAGAEIEHRIRQQYAFYFRFSKYRLGNRLRTEQRFYPDTYKNRLRYRLSLDFPLSGERLDVKEIYFVSSNEVLVNFNAHTNDVENRLGAGIGWKFKNSNKLQLQLQYRASKIGLDNESHAIFFATALYFSLS